VSGIVNVSPPSLTSTAASLAPAGGTKRKHKENAFTAKAETGTLKVKILRREQPRGLTLPVSASTTTKTRNRRSAKPPPLDSPPKPRPNRKHVPIFYDAQFRQPIKREGSHSSSTDESVNQSTSSTGVPGLHSTDGSAASTTAASTSSTTGSFVSQLSGVRLNSTSSSGGDIGPPPRANPLFARNDSDGLGTLGELLRPYFPSQSRGLQASFPFAGAQPTGTTSSAGLLVDQTGLTSALHQLASSSASYRSALDELTTSAHGSATSVSGELYPASSTEAASATATTTTANASDSADNGTDEGLKHYRFDPLEALQTAIAHAQRGSTSGSTSQNGEEPREIGSPNSSARFFRLEPSGSSEATHSGNSSTATSLGPPPELPPAFTLQNSLMGGGIQGFMLSKQFSEEHSNGKAKRSPSSDGKDAAALLGPPPDTPPSFLLQNSLTGGGISILNLPRSHPSLDRLGSLTSLIGVASEATKGAHSSLASPPKPHLSLDRLASMSSITSEAGELAKGSNGSASADDEAQSSGAVELGPPPSGPPAFTIGNSLMGGGIELQPAAANVNTHNFDWKLHRAGSTSGNDAHATRDPSHGLRARLERSLASTHNGSDKS
jgi:hypothetical protein